MPIELSEATRKRIEEEIIPAYPEKKSAILPVLWAIQDETGQVDLEAMTYVAELLGVSPAHVYGVVSFYTMFHQAPIGRYHIQVCRTLSCELMGSKRVLARLKEKLGIDPGETTDDGMFTLSEVECLGACEKAPMMQVNGDIYGPLTDEMVDEILDGLRNGEQRVKPCL